MGQLATTLRRAADALSKTQIPPSSRLPGNPPQTAPEGPPVPIDAPPPKLAGNSSVPPIMQEMRDLFAPYRQSTGPHGFGKYICVVFLP